MKFSILNLKFRILCALCVLCGESAFAQANKPWGATTRPAFVIACYQQPPENFVTWKARGINAVVGPELGNPVRMTAQQWCDEAASKGLWVIGNKALLSANYRPANLLAWALDDEPNETNHLTPSAVVAQQAADFRTLASDVPVWLNFGGDRITSAGASDVASYVAWSNAADIVSEDWYPINREFARYPISLKGKAMDWLASNVHKPQWNVVECSWQRLNKADPKGRGPTADELEATVFHAVLHGARGIVYFSTCPSGPWPGGYDPTTAEVAGRMTLVNGRLAAWNAGNVVVTAAPATRPVVTIESLDARVRALEAKQ